MAVTEDHGAPGADAVDVLEVVGVENPRALPLLDEGRRSADGAKRAHGRVHAAGDDGLGALEEGVRLLGHLRTQFNRTIRVVQFTDRSRNWVTEMARVKISPKY